MPVSSKWLTQWKRHAADRSAEYIVSMKSAFESFDLSRVMPYTIAVRILGVSASRNVTLDTPDKWRHIKQKRHFLMSS